MITIVTKPARARNITRVGMNPPSKFSVAWHNAAINHSGNNAQPTCVGTGVISGNRLRLNQRI